MKASELRIGNWVNVKQYPYENEPYKVTSLHGDNTFTIDFKGEIKGCFRTSIIEPIPLTEEWLLKFGLKFSYYSDELNCYNYWNKEKDFSVDFDGDLFHYRLYETKRRKHIKYVHQLQNLYFALKGEELELK